MAYADDIVINLRTLLNDVEIETNRLFEANCTGLSTVNECETKYMVVSISYYRRAIPKNNVERILFRASIEDFKCLGVNIDEELRTGAVNRCYCGAMKEI